MSTDNQIQFLDTLDAEGNDLGAAVSNRRCVETFLAGGTIAAGDVVMTDVSAAGAGKAATVVQCGLIATGNPLAIGVAIESAVSGGLVKVVIAGYVEGVDCTAGTILAGAALSAGKTAAAEVETSANTDTAGIFGVALEAKGGTTANKVTIMVKRQF